MADIMCLILVLVITFISGILLAVIIGACIINIMNDVIFKKGDEQLIQNEFIYEYTSEDKRELE